MLARVLILLQGVILPVGAMAATPPRPANPVERPVLPVPSLSVEGQGREGLVYQRAMLDLSRAAAKGEMVTLESFRRSNWVERIAAVNFVCSVQSYQSCRSVLSFALDDRALVVRDHGLRLVLASRDYAEEEKRQIASRIVSDQRNYRRGLAFWIVERARKFLGPAGG